METISTEKDVVRERFEFCPVLPTASVCEEEHMLRGDNGIGLRTIVCRPEVDVPVPVVVMRTCYPKQDGLYRAKAEEFAKRGIAFVFQYCRGVGGSEGIWEPNVNEREDGMTLMQWLCGQEWCDCIGYWGCSYVAFNGWIIADIVPDKVKTMYLTHYGAFRHISAYKDGLFRQDVLTSWTMNNAGFPVQADYLESAAYRPQINVDVDKWGAELSWYRKWITSPDESDSYWNEGLWGLMKVIPKKVRFPVYIGEGWYDHHLGSAIATYYALPEETKKKSVFLIGPWDHGFNVKINGYAKYGRNFDNNDDLRAFMWFYRLLKQGREPEGKIKTYVIGEDRWNVRKTFCLTEKAIQRFYFGGPNENGLSVLSDAEVPEKGSCQYLYDPDSPVPSHGAESLFHTAQDQGSILQPGPNYRQDVVSFVSAPLEKAITIHGKIRVNLTVSSSAEDTCFAVKISEIMADGAAYNIRNGITTLAYRNGARCRTTYEPGTKVDLCIDTWEVVWKLQKGSRLRVDISSSNFPEYAVHCNLAGIWSLQSESTIAEQTVFYGKGSVSNVELPVLL